MRRRVHRQVDCDLDDDQQRQQMRNLIRRIQNILDREGRKRG